MKGGPGFGYGFIVAWAFVMSFFTLMCGLVVEGFKGVVTTQLEKREPWEECVCGQGGVPGMGDHQHTHQQRRQWGPPGVEVWDLAGLKTSKRLLDAERGVRRVVHRLRRAGCNGCSRGEHNRLHMLPRAALADLLPPPPPPCPPCWDAAAPPASIATRCLG
jgi:hypothetical protein